LNLKPTLVAACLAALACGGAQAQSPAPAAAASAAQTGFTLRSVAFRGNAALDDATLAGIAAPYLGRDATLATLERIAADVTAAYKARGYFLAQALVPQQQIRDGAVEISVLEGRLGKLKLSIAADAPVSEARVRAMLAKLPEGAALEQASYERTMLLLSDLPGLRVQSGLEQGAQTGTTDLVVEVSPAERRWQASMDVDNYGTEVSGRERASVTARLMSPFGLGDNLDARLMRTFSGDQTFGRLSYELPLGYSGLRGGVGYSRVGYELGAQYAALGATGTANITDVSLVYPLLRSRTTNLFARASFEAKTLRDETAAVELSSDKRVDAFNLAFNWESRDALLGGGYVNAGLSLYHGRLRIDDAVTRDLDQDDTLGHRTAGSYTKVNLQASRLQALFGRHNLFVSLIGQWANRNLDASEKLALGGDRAVRAYPSGEVLVDRGLIGSAEWRWSATDDLVVSAFFDIGHGDVWRDPIAIDTRNTRTLRGPGLGVSWSAPYGISVQGALAWRRGEAPVSETSNDDPRLLVQLRKTF